MTRNTPSAAQRLRKSLRLEWVGNARLAPFLCGPLGLVIAVVVAAGIVRWGGVWDFHFTAPLPVEVDLGEADGEQAWRMVDVTWDAQILSQRLEQVAPLLLAVTVGVFWLRLIATRNWMHVLMMVLAGMFLCRERHDVLTGMNKAIYVLGVVWLIWLIAWRDVLAPRLAADRHFAAWLLATVAMYALSQVLARRPLKHAIELEHFMHVAIEELSETLAHLMLLATAVIGSWRRVRPEPGSEQGAA